MPWKDPEKDREWRRNNRDHINVLARKNYRKNKEKLRLRRVERRLSCLMNYSRGPHLECACCGENHVEFLEIDHVNGKGNEHRRINKLWSGSGFYFWLIKNNFPKGFQVLCSNCNRAKTRYGKCPHQEEGNK